MVLRLIVPDVLDENELTSMRNGMWDYLEGVIRHLMFLWIVIILKLGLNI